LNRELKIFANVAGALPDIRIKLATAARDAAYDTIPELMEIVLKSAKSAGLRV
jgi:hypothetical protein